MNRYQGTKRLLAIAMTLGAYNDYRGWPIPSDQNPEAPGYLVEYEDGGKANDSRHAGYISWSPADVFERTYRAVPAPNPAFAPHQQRVVDEKADLDDRLAKLVAFLSTRTFRTVDPAEQDRLIKQTGVMGQLSEILAERIASF